MDEPELDLLVVNEMGLCGGHSSVFFLQLDYYALQMRNAILEALRGCLDRLR
jgi:hypothetical protein